MSSLRHPIIPALLWLTVVISCVASLSQRLSSSTELPFDTSIMALLPEAAQSPARAMADAQASAQYGNQLLLLIGSDSASPQQLREVTRHAIQTLTDSGQFASVSSGIEASEQQAVTDFYRPYHYQLLSQSDRDSLARGSVQPLLERSLNELYSPVSLPRPAGLLEDPLNLFGHWLMEHQQAGGLQQDSWGLTARHGATTYRAITARFAGNAFDLETQQRVIPVVEAVEQALEQQLTNTGSPPSNPYQLVKSGLIFHAAAGASQARHEISTIGLGSLLAIVAILLWHFRAPLKLLMPLVSIGTGLLLAITLSLWFFPRLHIITLAFGAGLVGVSIDYALHYLCGMQVWGKSTLRRILPGISLGLVSSVIAYTAQSMTPFPGLQQMAFFSATGLIGAWLTVVCWFPLLPATSPRSAHTAASVLYFLARQRLLLWAGCLVLLTVAGWGWSQLNVKDDLRNLQTSPASMLADEALIQSISQRPGASRYLLVSGDSTDQLLQHEEAFRLQLDQWIADGQLQNYLALSQFIPSPYQQQQNYLLIKQQLYQPPEPLQQFFTALGAPEAAAQSQALFTQPVEPLSVEQWQSSVMGQRLGYLLIGGIDTKTAAINPPLFSVISLGAFLSPSFEATLQNAVDADPTVEYVDKVSDFSNLLSSYRVTVSQWMLVAYAGILLLLSLRYGKRSLAILLPPLLATLLTYGLISALGEPLNLFHLLASLLVLGIGLDIGIFIQESDNELHSWEAVTLSALTSILAFGLLALSKTPVLHHFGTTVLFGIAATWLLSFLLNTRHFLASPPALNSQE